MRRVGSIPSEKRGKEKKKEKKKEERNEEEEDEEAGSGRGVSRKGRRINLISSLSNK